MGHQLVRLLSQHAHIGQGSQFTDIHVKDAAQENKGVIWAIFGDIGHQFDVEPFGDGTIIADHGMIDLGQHLIGAIPLAVELVVGGVARQYHRAIGLAPGIVQTLAGHHQQVAFLDQHLFRVQNGALDEREIIPLVHAVIDDLPAPARARLQRGLTPRGDHHVTDGLFDVIGVAQLVQRGQDRFGQIAFHRLAVDVGRALHRDHDLVDVFLELAYYNPGAGVCRQELGDADIEHAMPMRRELRHHLLRALIAEAPVDNREADDVRQPRGFIRFVQEDLGAFLFGQAGLDDQGFVEIWFGLGIRVNGGLDLYHGSRLGRECGAPQQGSERSLGGLGQDTLGPLDRVQEGEEETGQALAPFAIGNP